MTTSAEISMDNVNFVSKHLKIENNGKERKEKDEIERDLWTNKTEYMLSVIGYVVDLGSNLKL